jgi:hypothetical protein
VWNQIFAVIIEIICKETIPNPYVVCWGEGARTILHDDPKCEKEN